MIVLSSLPTTFVDKLVKKNELGQPLQLMDHQREILRLALDFNQEGRLPWDTILYSCIKKSGKTTINGALTLWWGFTQEAPNELLVLANDLEQTRRRRLSAVIYQGAAGSNHGSAGWSKKDAASANIQSVVLDPNTTSDCVMKFRNQIFVGRSDSAQMKDGAHIQMVREGKIIGERWAK